MIHRPTHRVREALSAGRYAAGCYIQLNSPESVEIAGAAGLDYVIIDCQHGAIDFESAVHMIRAAQAIGVTPLVRPVDHTPGFIMKVLDAGALGVVVPDIVHAAQARAVVSAARYGVAGNGGTRGACPSTRAAWHQTDDWPGFMQHANDTVSVWLILESREAFANADAILAVPGIDAVIPGTFDLSHQMQLFGQREHEAVTEACLSLTHKAAALGIPVVRSIRAQGESDMARERQVWEAHGARIFHIGGDRRLLRNAWRDRLNGLRS